MMAEVKIVLAFGRRVVGVNRRGGRGNSRAMGMVYSLISVVVLLSYVYRKMYQAI